MKMKIDHYEEAKEYFVEHGYSIPTIVKLMKGKVSRKTIYNWSNENNWEELRRKKVSRKDTLEEDLWDLTQQAIQEAKTNPDARTLFAVAKMVGVLKTLQGVKLTSDEDEDPAKPKNITAQTLETIEKEILGL